MRKLSLVAIILFLLGLAVPSYSQAETQLYFLAEQAGLRILYSSNLSDTAQALSSPEEGSVIVYDFDENSLAYVSQTADGGLMLYIKELGAETVRSSLLAGTNPSQIVLNTDYVYVSLRNPENKPTLIGLERDSLSQISTRSTNLSDSVLAIHESGQWLLAYNANGAMDIFTLPDTQAFTFPLPRLGYSIPTWSPTSGKLAFIAGDGTDNRFAFIFDFTTNTSMQLPLAGLGQITQAQWSGSGRYLVSPSAEDTSSLLIMDVELGSVLTLGEPGFALTPLTWSSGDSWLLYQAELTSLSREFFAFNPLTAEKILVGSPDATLLSAAWSPAGETLALIGLSSTNTVGIYETTPPQLGTWELQTTSNDGGLTGATLIWVGDALVLEYNFVLLYLDSTSNELTLLSPENSPVVRGSIRVE